MDPRRTLYGIAGGIAVSLLLWFVIITVAFLITRWLVG